MRKENPYAYQFHKYDKTRPENLAFLQRLRALLDQYPGTTTVGEIGDDNSLQTMAEYTSGGDKLHMAYSFDLLTEQHGADFFHKTVDSIEKKLTDGWPCWAIGNHDVSRVATRWQAGSPEQLKAYMAMLLTLRGSVCIYQGEELGLTEAELEYKDLVDPYGINFWPEYKGRDGCRTPMVWHNKEANGGFSDARPWLPVYDEHYSAAVAVQHEQENSILQAYRTFLGWRAQQPVLLKGDIEFLESPENTLVYTRTYEGATFLVALNLTDQQVRITAPAAGQRVSGAPDFVGGSWNDRELELQPWGVEIATL